MAESTILNRTPKWTKLTSEPQVFSSKTAGATKDFYVGNSNKYTELLVVIGAVNSDQIYGGFGVHIIMSDWPSMVQFVPVYTTSTTTPVGVVTAIFNTGGNVHCGLSTNWTSTSFYPGFLVYGR